MHSRLLQKGYILSISSEIEKIQEKGGIKMYRL